MYAKTKHSPELPDPHQGELFSIEAVAEEGKTDIPSYSLQIVDSPEGGLFPADVEPEEGKTTLQELTMQAAVIAAKKRNRQEGNRGKHSALEADGLFHPWVGSFLPGGFGVVMERNWEEAKRHAESLNVERLRKRHLQPQLDDGDHAADVFAAVAYVASRLDIGNGLKGEKPKSTVPPLATTQDKIMALMHGESAGYIPTTNREKNQGFEMLDYLGNPQKYPKGAGERLIEIFYKQQEVQQEKAGKTPEEARDMAFDSTRSVVNEWGDYAENAKKSEKTLLEIQQSLAGLDPRQSLKVAFADGDGYALDFRPLVRYFDLQSLPYYPGEEALGELMTRTDRTQSDDEKNKAVEDEYTRGNMDQAYVDRIDAVLRAMRIGEARKLLRRAIDDQQNRAAFWNRVLKSAETAGDFSQYITPVIERVSAA